MSTQAAVGDGLDVSIVGKAAVVASIPAGAMLLGSFLVLCIKFPGKFQACMQNLSAGILLAAIMGEMYPVVVKTSASQDSKILGMTIGFLVGISFMFSLDYFLGDDGDGDSNESGSEIDIDLDDDSAETRIAESLKAIVDHIGKMKQNIDGSEEAKGHIDRRELDCSAHVLEQKIHTLKRDMRGETRFIAPSKATQRIGIHLDQLKNYINTFLGKTHTFESEQKIREMQRLWHSISQLSEHIHEHIERPMKRRTTNTTRHPLSAWTRVRAFSPMQPRRRPPLAPSALPLQRHASAPLLLRKKLSQDEELELTDGAREEHERLVGDQGYHYSDPQFDDQRQEQEEEATGHSRAKCPGSLVGAVCTDAFVDGFLVGLSYVASERAGIVMAAATCIEMFFLGLTFSDSIAEALGRKFLFLTTVISPPIIIVAGAVLGVTLGGLLEQHPTIFIAFIVFGIVALVFLVTQELLISAFEFQKKQEDEGKDGGQFWVNIWIFVGIYLVWVISELEKGAGEAIR